MIKDYVARAMQIAMLEPDQLERLHGLEKAANYLIPNWNIQSLFGLPEIKYRYNIPEQDEAQLSHHRRIEKEILEKDFLKTKVFIEDRIERTHVQDWNVINGKDQILWDYAGSSKRGNLKEMLRGSLALLLMVAVR